MNLTSRIQVKILPIRLISYNHCFRLKMDENGPRETALAPICQKFFLLFFFVFNRQII